VQIPTSWDDTHVVAASVGEYVAIARRQGDVWHVGAMTDRKARTLKLPLAFLGPGRYKAELWVDDGDAKYGFARREKEVTAADDVTVEVAPAGGAYLKFIPTK
jgi:alpha-glucosidase